MDLSNYTLHFQDTFENVAKEVGDILFNADKSVLRMAEKLARLLHVYFQQVRDKYDPEDMYEVTPMMVAFAVAKAFSELPKTYTALCDDDFLFDLELLYYEIFEEEYT